MDSGAGGRCGTLRASSRAFRPIRAPHQNGDFARDIVHFDTVTRTEFQHGGDMDQYGDEHGR
eukprot:1787325-Lingulodinium_polyedra.AAC.1